MKGNDIRYLAVPLPPDIASEVAYGNYKKAGELIDRRLSSPSVPEIMKARLRLELALMEIRRLNYTIPEENAVEEASKLFEGVTRSELDELKADGVIDWIYLDGKVMFIEHFARNLPIYRPEYQKKLKDKTWKSTPQQFEPYFEGFQKYLTDGAEIGAHVHIRHTLTLDPGVIEHKAIRVHIPFPVERQQVSNVRIISSDPKPKKIPTEAEGQPTVFFEEVADEVSRFSVEYEYDNIVTYHDLSLPYYFERAEQSEIPEEEKIYLTEELPHIMLSPCIRMLAAEIVGDATNPLEKAKKIWDYLMDNVEYSLVREYPAINSISEFVATSRRGDCGVQAILFIALCRASGIPARWQSGLMSFPGHVWNHDWAMFYLPGTGWLFCDPSIGGIYRQLGEDDKSRFYFGNIDPYRMPANADFQSEFVPEKVWFRFDPCDNQDGEAEYEDRGLYYTRGDYKVEIEDIDIHLISE